jgi:hypothetical protein
MLAGKKTYITGIGAVLLAVGGAMHGDYTIGQAAQLAIEALMIMALRKGVS